MIASDIGLADETFTAPIGRAFGTRVTVATGSMMLPGWLSVPEAPLGAVVIPKPHLAVGRRPTAFWASELNRCGLATLLVDPLSPHEAALVEFEKRAEPHSSLLSHRLAGIVRWMERQNETRGLPLGVVGYAETETSVAAAVSTGSGRVSSVAVLGYPTDWQMPGIADGYTIAYLIEDEDHEPDQARIAWFLAAWFSRTLAA